MNLASISLLFATTAVTAAADVIHDLYPQQAFEPVTGAWDESAGKSVDIDGALAACSSDWYRVGVFRRDAGQWMQEAVITGPAGSQWASFGSGVRLQGSTLLASDPKNDTGGTDRGAAHVYVRTGTSWSPEAVLQPADLQPGDFFSGAQSSAPVALDVYGDWIAVGAREQGGGTGAVYVFQRAGTIWTQTQKIPAPGGVNSFGDVIRLEDRTLAVRHSGGFELYRRQGAQWLYDQPLLAPGGGPVSSISLRGDRIAAAEGPSIHLYRFAGGWTYESSFAHGLGIAGGPALGDGRMALWSSSKIFVFEEQPSGWTALASYVDLTNLDLVWSHAMDGDQLVMGYAWSWLTDPLSFHGTVQFATVGPGPLPYCTGKTNSDGCVASISSCGVPSAADPGPSWNPLAFDVTATDAVGQRPGMLFYGYAPTAVPFQGGTLCIAPPLRRTPVQLGGGDATPCSGTYAFDFLAQIQGGADPLLVEGADALCQWWYRDPGDPQGVGLTDALSLTVWP